MTTTFIWFMFDGDVVRFSLVDGPQQPLDLRRDPRVAVLVVDPARPTYYVELRGTAALAPDPGCDLERDVSIKYTGSWTDAEPSGTRRYAATIDVERTTSRRGHD